MALVSTVLEAQLIALSKEKLTPEEANKRFAEIITDYIKMATITVKTNGTGYNGFQVVSSGEGEIS